jgi:phage terminase small subunit
MDGVKVSLTAMEARFIRAYIETGSATEAAKQAGCRCTSQASFRTRGCQLLKKLNHPIQSLMAEAGITNLDILRSIKQGITARDTQTMETRNGKLVEHERPNWHARARFTDMAIKLAGGYPKNQMELPFEIKDGKINIVAEFATNTPSEEMGG